MTIPVSHIKILLHIVLFSGYSMSHVCITIHGELDLFSLVYSSV